MSKELEAFNRVWEDCSKLDLDYVSKHNLMDDLREIKQAITPPTADEVCKALSEELSGEPIYYDETNNEFYGFYSDEKDEVIRFTHGKVSFMRGKFTAKTLKMIAQFYEGEIR